MSEFRGEPLTGKEQYDKTGFYILWPLAAFPAVAAPVAMIASPKEFFADFGATSFMLLFGAGWMLFWGIIPIIAYRSDVAEGIRRSRSRAIIDNDGIEFDDVKSKCRMSWKDMKSIEFVDYSEGLEDILFKARGKKFLYRRWISNESKFIDEVKEHFPDAKL